MNILENEQRFKLKAIKNSQKSSKYREEERPYYALASGIVLKAVEDWDLYIQRGYKNQDFAGMRAFFKSEWCDFLLQGLGICGEDVLRVLERRLEER